MNYDIYVVRHVDENFKCCAQNNSSSMIYLLLENGNENPMKRGFLEDIVLVFKLGLKAELSGGRVAILGEIAISTSHKIPA